MFTIINASLSDLCHYNYDVCVLCCAHTHTHTHTHTLNGYIPASSARSQGLVLCQNLPHLADTATVAIGNMTLC